MTIIDASVAAKWVLAEEGSEQAMALLGSSEPLEAPSLATLEVGGAILRKCRIGEITNRQAETSLTLWQDILDSRALRLLPWEPLWDEAVRLSFAIRHPLHDCLYLAAAIQTGTGLWTADRMLHQRGLAVLPGLRLLETGIAPMSH